MQNQFSLGYLDKMKRRSKKDKDGRDYCCGCGKTYLSYPALYTHIKTKHDGKAPVGTKNCAQEKLKPRGRPAIKKDDTNTQNPDMNSLIAPPEKDIFKNFGESQIQKSELKSLNYFSGEVDGQCEPATFLQTYTDHQGRKKSPHPFVNIFQKFTSDLDNMDHFLSNPTPDTIFSFFLFNLSKLVDQSIYKVYVIFFKHFRECLNLHGKNIIKEYENQQKKDHQWASNEQNLQHQDSFSMNNFIHLFCESEKLNFIPVVSDFFILQYLPKHSQLFNQTLAIQILIDFCNWLYKKKFTTIKLQLDNTNNNHLNKTIFLNSY